MQLVPVWCGAKRRPVAGESVEQLPWRVDHSLQQGNDSSAYVAHLLVELGSGDDCDSGQGNFVVVVAAAVVIAAEVVDASDVEESLVADVRPPFLAPV